MKENQIISDDAQAANFREICMGNIAPGILYRSSHPIKDLVQDKTIAMLAGKARIAAVINLSDTKSGINSKAYFAPWYNSLIQKNKVIALNMDFSVTGNRFKNKLKDGFKFIIKTNSPWLIHCYAGVDRTGFFSMVLESFMGAVLDDVINDYLLSFNSIFESSIYDAQTTDTLAAMRILSVMSDSIDINKHNLQHVAEIYLQKIIKLSAENTAALKLKLAGTQGIRLSDHLIFT